MFKGILNGVYDYILCGALQYGNEEYSKSV